MRLAPLLALLLTPATPALAEERRVMVTGFERVRVEGPYSVEVRQGPSPAAVASGDPRALDALEIRVEDRTLVVRGGAGGWGGWPGARTARPSVTLTTPRLTALTLTGTGAVRAQAMAGADVAVAVTGSGRVEVAGIAADRLEAFLAGSGAIHLAGATRTARLLNTGVGNIEADGLTARDLTLQSESAGETRAHATRTAGVTALGLGSVIVTGPAACTTAGPGPITCGD